ncbi:hypothetical protein M434DRAFT_31388 [Hypoxylon sp. CO27-5]|nr:hypothetical protein M434DRAFT_31388 [Hypoxylon sp. CO27-5]
MADGIDEVLEKAARLQHRMGLLTAALAMDNEAVSKATQMKVDMFDGIRMAFKTLSNTEKVRLEQGQSSLNSRLAELQNREGKLKEIESTQLEEKKRLDELSRQLEEKSRQLEEKSARLAKEQLGRTESALEELKLTADKTLSVVTSHNEDLERDKKREYDERIKASDDKAISLRRRLEHANLTVEKQAKELDSLRSESRSLLEVAAEAKDRTENQLQLANRELEELRQKINELATNQERNAQANVELKRRASDVEDGVRASKRSRKDVEELSNPNPWMDEVMDLYTILQACEPVMDPEGSCSLANALSTITWAVIDEAKRDNILGFLQTAPVDKWYCLEELAQSGFESGDSEIVEAGCSKHYREGGHCMQIRSCNEGGIGGGQYGRFLCRMRSY